MCWLMGCPILLPIIPTIFFFCIYNSRVYFKCVLFLGMTQFVCACNTSVKLLSHQRQRLCLCLNISVSSMHSSVISCRALWQILEQPNNTRQRSKHRSQDGEKCWWSVFLCELSILWGFRYVIFPLLHHNIDLTRIYFSHWEIFCHWFWGMSLSTDALT